jgi:hypothetical protein
MPLGKGDVLAVLADPVLNRMNFFLDQMHISGPQYALIHQLIEDEQILVKVGEDLKPPVIAEYDAKNDTLETQKNVEPPLDLFNRSILIHECTHAIHDMDFVTSTSLANEAAAYLAQATFLLLSDPNPRIPPNAGHENAALPFVKRFKLNTDVGVTVRYDDVGGLIRNIAAGPAYQKKIGKLSTADGISKKPRPISGPRPLETGTLHVPVTPPSLDPYLLPILAQRFDASDVSGYGGRVKKLEEIFGKLEAFYAGPLLARLEVRRRGDKVAEYFHDHLSTATRNKLMGILRDRF